MNSRRLFPIMTLVIIQAVTLILTGCSAALLDEGTAYQSINKSNSGTMGTKTTINSSDYASALTKAIQFYDANKCGTGVATGNTFNWRGNCHTGDTMAGGYHDAGDHVKFGLPGSYTFMVLGWALYKYPNAFSASDKTKLRDNILKRFADYYMASYSKTGKTFYYDVGDGVADHAYWGAPESQTGTRTSYQNTYAQGYADIGGFAAAGLALMSLNMASVNATYAAQCKDYATNLYFDIKGNQKYYIPNSKGYYGCNPDQIGQSLPDGGGTKSIWDTIEIPDKLAMAAAFLYYADTARKSTYAADLYTYLTGNNRGGSAKNQDGWGMSWNDAYPSAFVAAYDVANAENDATKKTYYRTAIDWNMNYWTSTVPNTADPGNKMKWLSGWGACRYAASFAYLASLHVAQAPDSALQTLAKNQVNYILGDNKNNKSYMIGFGASYPQSPHHRAANPGKSSVAQYTITGGIVGGPNQNGDFTDDVNQFQYTELGLDYNAGLVGALAAMVATYGSGGGGSSAPASSSSSAPAASSSSAPGVTELAWNFNSDADGWTLVKALTGSVSGGIYNLTITGTDPHMRSPANINVNGNVSKYVKVRMKNLTSDTSAQIFFTTGTSTNWGGTGKSLNFTIVANDSSFREYVIDMSAASAWTGTITQIRLDPSANATDGNCNVDYIKISQTGTASSSSSSAVSSSSAQSSSGTQYVTITAPFTYTGTGTYHWKIANIPSFINNYSGTTVTINGVDISGLYKTTAELPAKQGGYYYIDYTGTLAWSEIVIQ